MRIIVAILLLLSATVTDRLGAQTFDIYLVDVEGGQATLYVSPDGESMLVDTGWPGERDAMRIQEVMAAAGVERIDRMLLSHYHIDHFGGLEELARRVPIVHFYDHGPSPESDRPAIQEYERTYAGIHAGHERTILRPGDTIPFGDVEVLVVASHDQYIDQPLAGVPGAGQPNPACSSFVPREQPEPDPDNDYSVGFVTTYGAFRSINLGDLTWNREPRLMCPNNLVGTVDVYVTSHHGVDRSGSPALVHGLSPRVAVMNNGTRKGGSVAALRTMYESPGLEDIWQLHWSHHGTVELNPAGLFIANIDEPETLARVIAPPSQGQQQGGGGAQNHEPAHWIRVSARSDGSFTVMNSRNGFEREYR